MNDYQIHLLILIGIYLILAQGFNLSFGLGRMFNLAHIAVYGIGAYTTALLSTMDPPQSFLLCMAASMAVSALFALILGAISLRLHHDYFAIGTLAFSAVITALLINWKSLTRGVLGIPGIPRPELNGIDFYNNANFLLLVSVLVVIVLAGCTLFFSGPFSRSLRAQAEDEYAASALGKDLRAVRNDSFILASALAGLSGSLFAYYINYIDPSSFGLNEMVFVLSIVIIGRPGSLWGVCLSTVFLVLLPEPLRWLNIPSTYLGPMRQLLHSVILFGVLYWKRESLFPRERVV